MKFKNNPFNIRSGSRWLGLSGNKNGFCEFELLDYGIRAAVYLLFKTYRKRGLITIKQIVSTFAPPSENNTDKYIDFVCSHSFIPKGRVLTSIDEYVLVLYWMHIFEQGHEVFPLVFVSDVICEYNMKLY